MQSVSYPVVSPLGQNRSTSRRGRGLAGALVAAAVLALAWFGPFAPDPIWGDGSYTFTAPQGWQVSTTGSADNTTGSWEIRFTLGPYLGEQTPVIDVYEQAMAISCGGPPGAFSTNATVSVGGEQRAVSHWVNRTPSGVDQELLVVGTCGHEIRHRLRSGQYGQVSIGYHAAQSAFAAHLPAFQAFLASWRWR